MAAVTVEDVWDTLNVGDSDIPEHATRTAADNGLILPEEFRKNAVKFCWELWEEKPDVATG